MNAELVGEIIEESVQAEVDEVIDVLARGKGVHVERTTGVVYPPFAVRRGTRRTYLISC